MLPAFLALGWALALRASPIGPGGLALRASLMGLGGLALRASLMGRVGLALRASLIGLGLGGSRLAAVALCLG